MDDDVQLEQIEKRGVRKNEFEMLYDSAAGAKSTTKYAALMG